MNLIISICNRPFEPKKIQIAFKENWYKVADIIKISNSKASFIVLSYEYVNKEWLYTVVPYYIPKFKLMKNDNQGDRATASWVLLLLGWMIGMIIHALSKLIF